jgi:hypothetical protein
LVHVIERFLPLLQFLGHLFDFFPLPVEVLFPLVQFQGAQFLGLKAHGKPFGVKGEEFVAFKFDLGTGGEAKETVHRGKHGLGVNNIKIVKPEKPATGKDDDKQQ